MNNIITVQMKKLHVPIVKYKYCRMKQPLIQCNVIGTLQSARSVEKSF